MTTKPKHRDTSSHVVRDCQAAAEISHNYEYKAALRWHLRRKKERKLRMHPRCTYDSQ